MLVDKVNIREKLGLFGEYWSRERSGYFLSRAVRVDTGRKVKTGS